MSDDLGSADQAVLAQPLAAGSSEEPLTAGNGDELLTAGPSPDPRPRRKRGRKRRAVRLALGSAIAIVVAVAAIAVTGYAAVTHLADNIHRIPSADAALDAANQPVMPAATRRSMTILLTGSENAPAQIGGSGALGSSTAPEGQSGLIALVHIDADRRAGAIVSIPPNALVRIPGHGVTQLWNALPLGGPSLLIRTVEHLTNVRIDHYSVVDFSGLASSLGPLGGVNVDVPDLTSSNGVVFHPGINHLTTATAIDYVRETSLSEEGRVLRQQALLRAILDKIAHEHLLNHPTAGFSILDAFTKALSVDSNFSNSALESLSLHLHLLGGGAGTFVSAPVARTISFRGQSGVVLNFRISRKMWSAIRHDAVAAFARRYPSTVTPNAPQ
jgi:LCP family protein required for cell wall assembly